VGNCQLRKQGVDQRYGDGELRFQGHLHMLEIVP
jgi:hypothetical protein